MSSRILNSFRERVRTLKDQKKNGIDPVDLLAWMEEVERRLDYLEIMAESPKEHA